MATPKHGPNCIACTDPTQAREQIAADRAALDLEAARAKAHREAGEAAREEEYQTLISGGDTTDARNRMLYELGTANAIQDRVNFHRAHLDRVENAHPRLTEDAA